MEADKSACCAHPWHTQHARELRVPQRALNHVAPIDALRKWQEQKPDLFKKQIENSDNQPGLDNTNDTRRLVAMPDGLP